MTDEVLRAQKFAPVAIARLRANAWLTLPLAAVYCGYDEADLAVLIEPLIALGLTVERRPDAMGDVRLMLNMASLDHALAALREGKPAREESAA